MTTIAAIDVIDLLPTEIEAILESDSYFSDITVVVAERGNVVAEMQAKQAVITAKTGKRGVSVVIPQLEARDPNLGGSYGPMQLQPAVQVYEIVEVNNGAGGTGKSARTIARRIRDILTNARAAGLFKALRPDENFLVPLNLKEANLIGYQCNFVCLEDDGEAISKVQPLPTFLPASGATPQTVTITAPSGSSVYYTTDGSHPWTGNPTATLYTAPITLATGPVILRARAFLTGSFPSDTQLSRYT